MGPDGRDPADTTTKTCPDCAEVVDGGARFCQQCGFRFPPAPSNTPEAPSESEPSLPVPEPEDGRPANAPPTPTQIPYHERKIGFWRGRSLVEKIALVGLAIIGVGVLVAALSNSGDGKGGGGGGAAGNGNGSATIVEFRVTGSTPSGVDITYGNDGSNYQGPQQPPMYETLPVDDKALYYAVTAQLTGDGNIACSVTIGGAVKVGHARGGYNICSAQLNKDFDGGWG